MEKLDVRYEKNGPGDYEVFAPDGKHLFNVWRPWHHPSRWLVSVGVAPVVYGRRWKVTRAGLEIIERRDLILDS